MTADHVGRRHDHAGRAETALQPMMFPERRLHRMQVAPSASPSIVRMSEPEAWAASIVQDFTALPSTWTTQAPHCDVSQPTCVPVSPEIFPQKMDQKRPVLDVALTLRPFTTNDTLDILSPLVLA